MCHEDGLNPNLRFKKAKLQMTRESDCAIMWSVKPTSGLQTMKQDFKKILQEVKTCTLCAASLPLGPRPVVQLHPAAKILIAGQAPGTRVHATGIAFNDPSGDRLRAWMGVEHAQFYDAEKIAILPMGFCYPGRGNAGDLPPRPECAAHWRARLLALLPGIELTLVIGQYAQDWHLADRQKATLTDTVRAWREYWPQMLVLPHPSPRNNLWLKKNPWFEAELLPPLQSKIRSLVDTQ